MKKFTSNETDEISLISISMALWICCERVKVNVNILVIMIIKYDICSLILIETILVVLSELNNIHSLSMPVYISRQTNDIFKELPVNLELINFTSNQSGMVTDMIHSNNIYNEASIL